MITWSHWDGIYKDISLKAWKREDQRISNSGRMHEWRGSHTLLSMQHLPLSKCVHWKSIRGGATIYLRCPAATPHEDQLHGNERQDIYIYFIRWPYLPPVEQNVWEMTSFAKDTSVLLIFFWDCCKMCICKSRNVSNIVIELVSNIVIELVQFQRLLDRILRVHPLFRNHEQCTVYNNTQ